MNINYEITDYPLINSTVMKNNLTIGLYRYMKENLIRPNDT